MDTVGGDRRGEPARLDDDGIDSQSIQLVVVRFRQRFEGKGRYAPAMARVSTSSESRVDS